MSCSKPPEAKQRGRSKLPDGKQRVQLWCRVHPATYDYLQSLLPPNEDRRRDDNIGRVLDQIVKRHRNRKPARPELDVQLSA